MQTGNSLDLAIGGEGFFKIQTPQGIRYTRNGTFTLNSDNMLVTQNGDSVLGEGGPILIDGKAIEISESGEIWVEDSTTKNFELAGKISVATFTSMEMLKKEGDSLFIYTGPAGDESAPEKVRVHQGELEMANVNTVVEMTKMIETTRKYESCMKMLQSLDETDAKAINELGKV